MRLIRLALVACLLWAQWSPFLRSWRSAFAEALGGRTPFLRSMMPRGIVRSVSRALLLTTLVILNATLPALAYGSPPDPSWIRGIYDDADYDDIVVLITSVPGHVGPQGVTDLGPQPSLAAKPVQWSESATPSPSVAALRPRAPPVL